MDATTVHIEAHPTRITHGGWCDTCGTHSVLEVTVAIAAADTLHVLGHVTGQHCTRCDQLHVTR